MDFSLLMVLEFFVVPKNGNGPLEVSWENLFREIEM